MTHASIPKEERDKIGITDTLVRRILLLHALVQYYYRVTIMLSCIILILQIRMSVGLEDTADIIEDLEQALKVKLMICSCHLKVLQCHNQSFLQASQ